MEELDSYLTSPPVRHLNHLSNGQCSLLSALLR
jgi:hypothetical protein